MRLSRFAAITIPLALSCSGAATAHAVELTTVPSLEEMVVTPTRTENATRDVPASITVIDRQAIELSGAVTVDELFRTVLGAELQGSGVPGSPVKLSFRGLTAGYQTKRVLVLIDGRRANEQYQGNVEFATIPADTVQRIEVLRGPASAIYGSNAQGGVVNIITRDGTIAPSARLRVLAGSHDTWQSQYELGGAAGRWDYYTSAGIVITDGYLKNQDGSPRDWYAGNLSLNLGYQISDTQQTRLQLGVYSGGGTDENNDRTVDKDYQSLSYDWAWDAARAAALKVLLYRNGEKSIYDWNYPGRGVYDMQTLGLDLQQTLQPHRAHRLVFGVDTRRDEVDIDEVSGPINESSTTLSGYLQDEWGFAEDWALTAGVRVDDETDYGTETSPRIALLYHLTGASELFGSVNRAYRAPGLSDRYVNVEFNGMRFEGNPELKPETLTAYEVGGRWRPSARISTEATLFYNDLEDTFDFMFQADGSFRNENVTESSTQGIELGARLRMDERFTGFANYSYTDGSYESSLANPDLAGNQIAYLAPHKFNIGVDFTHPVAGLHALTLSYVDSRYGDAQNSEENRMDSYILVNWRSRLALSDGTFVSLKVDNVMDEEYQEFPQYAQPGRTFLAGLEVIF